MKLEEKLLVGVIIWLAGLVSVAGIYSLIIRSERLGNNVAMGIIAVICVVFLTAIVVDYNR